jgi:perosamine synthetase
MNSFVRPMKEQATRRKIAAQQYDFPPDDVDVLLDQIRELLGSHGFLTLGRYGDEFEARFAQRVGTKHAIAVSNGTAALEIILRALDLQGGEVVVPTNTFAASAFAVLHAGGSIVFADCGPDLCIDAEDVKRRISQRTRAVMIVHIGGVISPQVVELQDLCMRMGIPLIEDAAHAHGSTFSGKQAGAFGLAAGYSFFSTKVITMGEGGMIATNDDRVAEYARLVRDQAKVSGLNRHDVVGYNWRLTEMQAMMGILQLARLDAFISERTRVARIYDDLMGASDSRLDSIQMSAELAPNYYKYVLFAETEAEARRIRDALRSRGITLGGAIYDVPCHQQPVFSRSGTNRLPHAEDLCRRHICPPIYPSLTNDEAAYVAQSLIEVSR